jgi:DNA mismatch repair ATPase MutS
MVAPQELLMMHRSEDHTGSGGRHHSGVVNVSAYRQHLPSCHVRLVVDQEQASGEVLRPVSEYLTQSENAEHLPVRVPLKLGRSLLRSLLSSTASSPALDPSSLTDEACGVLLAYLNHNLRLPVNPATFTSPQAMHRTRFMHIDVHAARALELTRAQDVGGHASLGGSSSGSNSVLKQLDKTVTAGGSRCLQAWLLRPLVDVESIAKRQDAVECFVVRPALRREVRAVLEGIGDMQRCMQKMLLNRAAPSDASSLARSLFHVQRLHSALAGAHCASHHSSNITLPLQVIYL